MLVLSRKPQTSIMIGSSIEVTVLSVSKHRVKIGINAPSDVRIVRSELSPLEESPSTVQMSYTGKPDMDSEFAEARPQAPR